MDGERVDLPDIESGVVLNIPCWGAGVQAWSLGQDHAKFPPPSMSDEKLEVFCVYSSFHIAQMQVRPLTHPSNWSALMMELGQVES